MRNKVIPIISLVLVFVVFLVEINAQTDLDVNGQPIKFIETHLLDSREVVLINSVIKNYEEQLIQAINNNNFNLVEPYLIKGSVLYNEQKKLVDNLTNRGIKERLESFNIIKWEDESEDEVRVFVVESIEIKNGTKSNVVKEFQWIYTLQKRKAGLSKIERWTDYDNYLAMITASVKANGYYVDELANFYASILLEAINTLDIIRIKEISGNKVILEKQKQLITKLRKIGFNFEIIETNTVGIDCENWKGQIVITFSYNDRTKKKSKIKQTLYFEFDEVYQGVYGTNGKAVIKEMVVLD